jgi:hypothetical protein
VLFVFLVNPPSLDRETGAHQVTQVKNTKKLLRKLSWLGVGVEDMFFIEVGYLSVHTASFLLWLLVVKPFCLGLVVKVWYGMAVEI